MKLRVWFRLLTATTVGAVALTACGDSRHVDVAVEDKAGPATGASVPDFDHDLVLADGGELGACTRQQERDIAEGRFDVVPLHDRLFRPSSVWYLVDGVELADPAGTTTTVLEDRSIPVTLVGARRLTGNAEAPGGSEAQRLAARRFGPSWPHTALALRRGYTLYVAVAQDTRIDLVVAVDGKGRLAFVGECEVQKTTAPMAGYLQSLKQAGELGGRTAGDVLVAIAREPGGAQAVDLLQKLAGPPPVAWIDLPPDERGYDPDAMPEELQARLQGVVLLFDLPAAWRSRTDVTLCWKVPQFWGECISLNLVYYVDGHPTDQPLKLIARPLPGDAVEVWLTEEPPQLGRNALGVLATVDAETVAAAVSSQSPIIFGVPADVDAFEELLARVRSGQPGLVPR